ncbi:MAG: HigA family addiction module antitoxin [Bacteroidota bacterium]
MDKIPNIHPGEVIEEEFLKPMGLSTVELSRKANIPEDVLISIIKRERDVTADVAWRLARFFNTTSRFWMGLQIDYDLEEELRANEKEFEKIKPYVAA